jgi:hypothetical protein
MAIWRGGLTAYATEYAINRYYEIFTDTFALARVLRWSQNGTTYIEKVPVLHRFNTKQELGGVRGI